MPRAIYKMESLCGQLAHVHMAAYSVEKSPTDGTSGHQQEGYHWIPGQGNQARWFELCPMHPLVIVDQMFDKYLFQI